VFVAKGEEFESRLVRINRGILRIPNLAIHLNREVNEKGFQFNTQTNLLPFLATTIKNELEAKVASEASKEDGKKESKEEGKYNDPYCLNDHPSLLIELLAQELKVEPMAIKNFELCLYDTQPATLSGVYNEFIVARGLDNLLMSFVCLRSLIDSSDAKEIANESQIRMVGLFDNEEIGSNSMMGAASNMMNSVLHRIIGDHSKYDSAITKSFLMSCDMAHGLHPNWPEKHEECHRPHLHKGLVVKQNANQRYATSGVTQFLITEIAKAHKIPLQKFVVRNDVGCGSTIGPILASNTGIRTVDVGIPQLAMHSIREMSGTADLQSAYELVKAVFSDLPALDRKTRVDA
jgi:aspartyl aminopeptidase